MTRVWLILLVVVAVAAGTGTSGADFTASSASPTAFAAAASFNTVAVGLTDPGTPLRGTVPLAATASSDRGIERVRFQTAPAGTSSWTDACEDAVAPYGCDWNTAGVADGLRDVRALAVDQAGYTRASVVASRRVDNTAPTASLADPGAYLQGSESLTATATDGGSGLASITIEHRPAGGGSWTAVCTGATSPRTCSLATAGLPDGDRELRVRAVDAAGNERVTTPLVRRVDNTAPTVSVTSPAAVRGTVSVTVDAADGAGSGVDRVWIDVRMPGVGWTEVCSDTTAPYSCGGLDTTQVPDGVYEARARAADETGLQGTSDVLSVRVDNTAPSAALDDPGTPLSGSEALTGTAGDSGSGVASWTVQYRTGGGAWTAACSDSAAPFTCAWNTGAVADGAYELRAVVRDVAGNETVSAVRTGRAVDNTAPAGSDVQAGNVGVPGRFTEGDWVRLTWTEQIAPGSVLSGWDGGARAITVSLDDRGNNDRMDFLSGATRLNLVSSDQELRLGGNYVGADMTFSATMVRSGASITITFGSVPSPDLQTSGPASMTWRPAAGATDLAGNPSSTAAVGESGGSDVDF